MSMLRFRWKIIKVHANILELDSVRPRHIAERREQGRHAREDRLPRWFRTGNILRGATADNARCVLPRIQSDGEASEGGVRRWQDR
jgi:hypothetical protein